MAAEGDKRRAPHQHTPTFTLKPPDKSRVAPHARNSFVHEKLKQPQFHMFKVPSTTLELKCVGMPICVQA